MRKFRLRRGFRLFPLSLFGQLFFIFSLAFLALLLIGAYHASEAKQFYILRGVMSDRARRMADIAILLDTAAEAERARAAERMSVRGFSISLQPGAPDLDNRTPETLLPVRDRLLASLNRALADALPTSDAAPPVQAAVIQVAEPSFMDDLISPLKSERPAPQSLYQARVAIRLADGAWAVFDDDAPDYSGPVGLPYKGILATELFFMTVSLLAFYLAVKPLRRLAQAAESLGRDVPGAPPLPETGPLEVRESAQAFNRMQRRIREFVDERARTVAAVSHDLRTPLTRMRLRVEQLDESVRAPLQKDMDDLQRIMDTTIDLARGPGDEKKAPVDVASLLESLADDRRDMGQDVTLAPFDPLPPIMARPLALKRCLDNILDNAVRYGHSAHIALEISPDELAILVRDKGPGLPEDELERVFTPFRRLEPSRNRETGGSGLGLSIARGMARMDGGDVTLANHPQGGLAARLTLPRGKGKSG